MNKNGPIIVIEDDADDQEILGIVFKKLNYRNKIIFFESGNLALDHLYNTDESPFLILSDINMPLISGFELRSIIFTDKLLQRKCTPYLFFTTTSDKASVLNAYALSVQGFFKKPATIDELERTISRIVEYWQECISPNDYL